MKPYERNRPHWYRDEESPTSKHAPNLKNRKSRRRADKKITRQKAKEELRKEPTE